MIFPTGPFRKVIGGLVLQGGRELLRKPKPKRVPGPKKPAKPEKGIEIEVRPCPCCGGNDLFVDTIKDVSRVHCRDCSLSMKRLVIPVEGLEDVNQKDLGVYWLCKAINAWNRRA